MRAVFLALFVALPVLADGPGQVEPPAPAPSQPPTLPARVGEPGVLLLSGGSRLSGKLVSSDPEGDVVELRSGERLRIAPGTVVGRLGGPDRWDAPEGEPPPTEVRLVAKGRTVEGVLVGRSGGVLRVRVRDGAPVDVAEADLGQAVFLAELQVRRTEWTDPGRVRYLGVRQAGALLAREWTLRTSAESALEISYGVADWVTVSGGVDTPVLYGSPIPPVGFRLDATGHLRLGPGLRLSAGVTTSTSQGATAATLHGEATVGSRQANLTVYAGPPLVAAGRLGAFDAVVAGAGASLRVSDLFGLIAEGWITPRRDHPEALGALAARVLANRLALDVGAMLSTSGKLAPWVAISLDGAWGPR